MGRILSPEILNDYFVEVARGNVSGQSLVHKFGRNDAVASGVWELISQLSAATSFRSSASTVRIKAGGNAADTAAGAGAREITVVGIDDNLAEITETIATAGGSASSATTASFWRIYRAYVSAVGTYGVANTGIITIEDSGGAADMLIIAAAEGQSQHAAYTIPTGKTGYLTSIHLDVDAGKAADFRFFIRENFNDTSAPMSAKRLTLYWDGVLGTVDFKPEGPIEFPALTDIWIEAEGSGAGTEVSADFEILIIDD